MRMFGEKDEFDQKEVTYTSAYLSNKSQRTNNASHISDFADLLFDVPQGSVADSLIFNTYTRDLLVGYNHTEFTSFAVDAAPQSYDMNSDEAIKKWRKNSSMFSNGLYKTFSMLTLTSVDVFAIENSYSKEYLGMTFDNNLTFDQHFK